MRHDRARQRIDVDLVLLVVGERGDAVEEVVDPGAVEGAGVVRHAHVADNGTDDPSTQIVRGSRDVEPDSQGLAEAERIGRSVVSRPVRENRPGQVSGRRALSLAGVRHS